MDGAGATEMGMREIERETEREKQVKMHSGLFKFKSKRADDGGCMGEVDQRERER